MPRKESPAAPATEQEVVTGTTPAAVMQDEVAEFAIVPRSGGAVVNMEDVSNLMIADAEEDLGFGKDDVAIPFFRVLQSNSPQVKRQNGKFVEGAEAGQFFNSATQKVYSGDAGLFVVPVHFERQATLWLPRGEGGSGGGFVASIPMAVAEELLPKTHKSPKGKDLTPAFTEAQVRSMDPNNTRPIIGLDTAKECELVISAMYYMMVIDKDDPTHVEPVAFPLTSTQMKKSRTWNALIKNARLPNPGGFGTYRPAMFGYCYKLTTVPEQNVHGDWMGVRILQDQALIKYENGVPVEQFPGAASIYLAARDFKSLVAQGKVKTIPDDDMVTEVEGGAGGDDDEKPPF
jgi:hypothetical protein